MSLKRKTFSSRATKIYIHLLQLNSAHGRQRLLQTADFINGGDYDRLID